MDENDEIRKLQRERAVKEGKLVGLGSTGGYDEEIYGSNSNSNNYVQSISTNYDDDDEEDEYNGNVNRKLPTYTVPEQAMKDILKESENEETILDQRRAPTISDRDNSYTRRRFDARSRLSPDRVDPFGETPDVNSNQRSYKEIMENINLDKEEFKVKKAIKRKLEQKQQEESLQPIKKKRKRSRWDSVAPVASNNGQEQENKIQGSSSSWEGNNVEKPKRKRNRWDLTPDVSNKSDLLPSVNNNNNNKVGSSSSSWEGNETPKRIRNRWDATPDMVNMGGETPVGNIGLETPDISQAEIMKEQERQKRLMEEQQLQGLSGAEIRYLQELEVRNRPLTDEELDQMFPTEGYKVLEPPEGYKPPERKSLATPTPRGDKGFMIQEDERISKEALMNNYGIVVMPGNLPNIKPEDEMYFKKLLQDVDETELSIEEQKERKIMKLLLKVKNGSPPQRKIALRQITDKARDFGAGPLFNNILPLLMSPTLEDQERHLLVKVIDRILYKLDDLVRPFVHKILVVIEPLLIDEDYYARIEGREIISNLSKAAGLATMIITLKPDIDHVDEYVRNTTARAFSVVASALGIPALLPFLKAVCQTKKSWEAAHTGIKIIQQIAILMGCAILPHLNKLVQIIQHGLTHQQQKVRTICALALAALAEASAPYGIESFDCVLKPLWYGIRKHRGKTLAAFLKAIGYIIPLMDEEYASYYTKQVMKILIREFSSPDEEMKKIVLKVVKQCVSTNGVEPNYIRLEILPEFFKYFWIRRTAADKRNYRQLVETTVEIANKVGGAEIITRLVEDLSDDNETLRKMSMETIEKVIANLGVSDIDKKLEERLLDGILFAFQKQQAIADNSSDLMNQAMNYYNDNTNQVMLNGFGTVVNALGIRIKPYLPQIVHSIKFKLGYRSAKVRQQAADLISRIAVVMKSCGDEQLMNHLSLILYENLGEEYPDVLASFISAMSSILSVIGMNKITPPIKDLLPRLTPILKNRHERVQESVIDLVGRIADRGHEHVNPREWMRICFELLEMLKAHKKGIRRATVNTFGYIAKAIGPQDVIHTLLNNLRVQERQNRVCTTVSIGIIAETCGSYTVLPALMNEYRFPELNVQNGILKSLSFLFEYISEMGKDYIYAVTPLLIDALIDRDLVHRQIACNCIKHMALGCFGLSREDALLHLLNYVWPNIFETSPHMIKACIECVESLQIALGPTPILYYTLQGLFHPARKVRNIYWKIYNNLYIGSQDALTPAYPLHKEEPYNIPEVTYFI